MENRRRRARQESLRFRGYTWNSTDVVHKDLGITGHWFCLAPEPFASRPPSRYAHPVEPTEQSEVVRLTEPAAPISAAGNVPRTGRRKLGATGILAALALILPIAFVPVLAAHLDWVKEARAWLTGSLVGPVICTLAFVLIVGLALLPTLTLSLFAGWAFGFPQGALVPILGFGGGALINYFIARRTAGRNIVETIDEHPRWRAIHRALLGGNEGKTFLIIALLRLPTFPPFGATTVALAAMHVPYRPFLLGTMAGVIPRTLLYVWLASRLQPDRFDPNAGSDWVTFTITGAVSLIVLAWITVMARRALRKLTAMPAGFDVVKKQPS
jgi:uncharacterized membrane protein YdjX (TVP38/TMEM64 family)